MGKISPISSKYIINASIEIEGVVDKPDVIGAIFGQTEGLLGEELELRELQRSGRIGRIEVNTEVRGGKTAGGIIIPSSLDKAETAVVGAALEIIERIGPCNARLRINNIEDVRVSKRNQVVSRAKELLRSMMDSTMPDSTELMEEVTNAVRVAEAVEYGRDRLPAGPAIDESDEIIVVEGRADVLTLLRNGFKNVIAINGTSVPQTVIDLSRKKDVILFVDGDRGGNLIAKEMLTVAEVDFVTRAPDGKEVEELAKKEIHKALRSKITAEQAKHELATIGSGQAIRKPMMAAGPQQRREERDAREPRRDPRSDLRQGPPVPRAPAAAPAKLGTEEKSKFGIMLENLIGTRGAYLLDEKLNILGKVPLTELATTLNSLKGGVYAVVFDGVADAPLAEAAEHAGVRHLIGMDAKLSPGDARVNVVTVAEL
jgi:5S rRNA maturation endonuclease (ribonuclease M5)